MPEARAMPAPAGLSYWAHRPRSGLRQSSARRCVHCAHLSSRKTAGSSQGRRSSRSWPRPRWFPARLAVTDANLSHLIAPSVFQNAL